MNTSLPQLLSCFCALYAHDLQATGRDMAAPVRCPTSRISWLSPLSLPVQFASKPVSHSSLDPGHARTARRNTLRAASHWLLLISSLWCRVGRQGHEGGERVMGRQGMRGRQQRADRHEGVDFSGLISVLCSTPNHQLHIIIAQVGGEITTVADHPNSHKTHIRYCFSLHLFTCSQAGLGTQIWILPTSDTSAMFVLSGPGLRPGSSPGGP